jgi:peroxiredoxin
MSEQDINDTKLDAAFHAAKKAPQLKAVDVLGNKVSFKDYDQDYILLVFLRYSGCPWCNLAIHRLSIEYPHLEEYSCQVIALVQSDKENILHNIYDRHEVKPPFPIIADPAMKQYKQYAVDISILGTARSLTKIPYWVQSVKKHGFKQKKIDGNIFLVPAWFLINNRTGKIIKSERGVSFYNHESFIKIYDSLIFKD